MIPGIISTSIELNNTLVVRYLEGARWYPGVLGFGGYGSHKQARIMGRALMTKTGDQRNWLGEKRGWRQFIDAQVPRQPILIRFGNSLQIVRADRGGYLDVILHDHGLGPGWHSAHVHVVHRHDLARASHDLLGGKTWHQFSAAELARRGADLHIRLGRGTAIPIRIVGPDEKIGIISDVDDSIMVTMVPRPLTAARNAFIDRVSQRKAVPGMATFLTNLRTEASQAARSHTAGTPAVHSTNVARSIAPPVFYLSTGAWNVAPMLRKFLQHGGFPLGTPLLRAWGPTDQGLPTSGVRHKLSEFTKLTTMLPHVKWLMLGDDGQHDPTTFTTIGKRFPNQLAAVFIHTLSEQEHLLTHGTTKPLDPQGVGSVPEDVPVLSGHDGHCLNQQIEQESFRATLRRRLS